jgi:hypothetical protein
MKDMLGRPRHRQDDYITIMLGNVDFEDVDWVEPSVF